MAGAVDLFSGNNSISGSNLFYLDKNPLDQMFSKLGDMGQRDDIWTSFAKFAEAIVDNVVTFFENLTGLELNSGPLVFFASLWENLNNITGLRWDDGPITFLVSIVDSIVAAIEQLTNLNINEGPVAFFDSLWTNLENATGLNWNEGPIPFLVSVVDNIVAAIETLTSLNINEGPGPFFDSLWTALENATGLNWNEGPIPFLVSVVDGVVSAIEALTHLNINEGPEAFIASLGTALNDLTGWVWTEGPEVFISSVVSATIAAIEGFTNLNIDEGPIAFFDSLFTNLEDATGLVWKQGPGPFIDSVVAATISAIEYWTGLNIDEGPGPFLESLLYEITQGPVVALGEMMQALDATGQGLAEKIGRAIIAVISGIPFVGNAIADTLTSMLDGLVLWLRGGNQSGSNLLADPGAEQAKIWNAVYLGGVNQGQRKQPEVNRDTTVKRSAGASLRLVSGGANPQSYYWNVNDQGDVVPISTTAGDWFYAECYVVAPNTNTGSAAVTLVAEFSNSVNPNTKTTATVTEGISKGDWNKIAGTFTVPAGYDRISFGFLLGANNTTSGDKFYVDDMLVREVTGTQNTLQGIHQAIRGGDGTTLVSLSAVGTALGGITDLTRGTSEAGSNLLTDPKASYPSLWIAPGLTISKAVGTYRSASSSLAFTSTGATPRSFDWTINDTGATTPIVAQPGDVFYCECYVLSPPGNAGATIILHGKAKNSETGATLTLTPQLNASVVASGPWTKISGNYTIPSSGYDSFIAGITLAGGTTRSGDKFYIDDMVVREITGTQTTIDELGKAVNPSAPTGNNITNVRDAVANVFDLSRGSTQSGSNLLADPKINYPKFWTSQAGLVVNTNSTYSRSTANSLQFTSTGATARSFDFNVNDLAAVTPIVARPGNVYYCEAWVYSPTGNSSAIITLHGKVVNLATGLRGTITAASGSAALVVYPATGTWNKAYGYFKVPDTFTPDGGGTARVPDGFVSGITLQAGWSTAGQVFYIDDLTITDVTESYNTNLKLYNAPTPAATVVTDALPTIPTDKIPTGIPQANISGVTDLNSYVLGGTIPGVGTVTGINTTVNGAGGLTTSVPSIINGIGQGINNDAGAYTYGGVKNNFQKFLTAIGVGIKGEPSSRIDALGQASSYYSYLDVLNAGNASANSIAAVAAAVAELQKKSSASASSGTSVYTPFSTAGLNSFSRTNSVTGNTYVSTNNQAVWSGGGGRTYGIYPTATQTNNQRVGVAFASGPTSDIFGNPAFNYIIGRANSTGSVCVYAKFSNSQCWLGYTLNGFTTENVAYGPVAHTFNPNAVYWLECGDSRGETYYKISAGGTAIIDPGALSFFSSYTNSSYRYGGYGAFANQPAWTNPPGSMAAWSISDNTVIDYPGIALRKYKTDNITQGVNGTAGQLTVAPFTSGWYNNQNYLTTPTVNGSAAGLTFSSTDNAVTINLTGWYSVTVSQAVWNNANMYGPYGVGVAVMQSGSITQNYMGAFWQSGTDGTTQKRGPIMGTFMIFCKKGDVLKPGYATTSGPNVYTLGSGLVSGTVGVTNETWFSVHYVNTAT